MLPEKKSNGALKRTPRPNPTRGKMKPIRSIEDAMKIIGEQDAWIKRASKREEEQRVKNDALKRAVSELTDIVEAGYAYAYIMSGRSAANANQLAKSDTKKFRILLEAK